MKKLLLTTAILLGSFTSFASTPIVTSNSITVIQQEYKEIATTDLPEAVQNALKASYPDASIDKAYVNEKKEFKIEITVGDQKAAVFADADGNWIKK